MPRYPIERHALLRSTFVHLPTIGPRMERHLWRQGITDWEELARVAPQFFKNETRCQNIQRALASSLQAWDEGQLYYFDRVLPGHDRWRMIPGAFSEIAYVDIEATGGGMPPFAHSTAVSFYFRGQVLQEYEHERKRAMLAHILAEAAILCSYNGASYDLPFLAAEFGLSLAKPHLDLCPWLRRLGYQGGLKRIQQQLPHLHQRNSAEIDGFDAIRLWHWHLQGQPGALASLLAYNAEDTVILEPLLVHAYNQELLNQPEITQGSGIELLPLVAAATPTLPTSVDPMTLTKLRQTRKVAVDPTRIDRDFEE